MYKKIVKFRHSISGENIGIMFFSSDIVTIPMHSRLTNANYRHIDSCDYAFVCGTNLISSNMRKRKQWDLSFLNSFKMHDVILLSTKSKSVITTLTNYMQNDKLDTFMFETLMQNYETVYVWLQAIEDYAQLQWLGVIAIVMVVSPILKAYDEILKCGMDCLHGGIWALNVGRRSLILVVDNRAVKISKDTELPIIKREDVRDMLDMKINESLDINIALPGKNIIAWKSQFICGYVIYFACPFALQVVG